MSDKPVILLLETEAVARHALAQYLRACGYLVVETANTDEAIAYFKGGAASVETALLDVRAAGAENVFELATWIRSHCSADVVLVGAIETAAHKAAELCKTGPTLARPYEHTAVVDLIKRLRAERDRRQ
jgi:CheY-like chemotaxis protein